MSDRVDAKCPQCGADLAGGQGPGICPRCAAGFLQATETQLGGSPPFTPPSIEELAPRFPSLEILEFIGQGGMGAVYKARQKALGRVVALKILPPRIGQDPAFADRFTREARALARLNHPGIVTLYEFGQADGLFFFLMEFVDGVNLRQLLSSGRVAPREALAIVPQICDALQYAHDEGIVHRDIKPENILLDRRGRVKVADFGLAKLMASECGRPGRSDATGSGAGEECGRPGRSGATGSGAVEETGASGAEHASAPETGALRELTEAGKVLGTPQYMSPEQIQAPGEVDHRADIYALGVVFYQMLTGELPGKDLAPPSTKVRIDVRLDEIVLRALEKDPERRYQQASVLKTRVETFAVNGVPASAHRPRGDVPRVPPRQPRRAWIIGAFIGLAVGIFAFVVAMELAADSGLLAFINAAEAPLMPLILWMHGQSGGWGSTADLYKFLVLVVAYWASIGALVGSFIDFVRSRRTRHAPSPGENPEPRLHKASVLKTQVETLAGPSEPRDEIPANARLSRLAIAAVGCLAFTLVALVVFLCFLYKSDKITPGAVRSLGPLFWLAPFVITGLGCWSFVRIRRSSGRLRGLALSLFSSLFFPLIFVDWLLFAAATYLGWTGHSPDTLSLASAPILGVLVLGNCLLVRWVWLRLLPSGAERPGSRKMALRWGVAATGIVPLLVATSLVVFLYVAIRSPVTSARQLVTACILSAQANSNQLPARLEDLKPYVGSNFRFARFALVSTGRLDALRAPAPKTVLFRTRVPDEVGRYVLAFADGHVEFRKPDPAPAGETVPLAAMDLKVDVDALEMGLARAMAPLDELDSSITGPDLERWKQQPAEFKRLARLRTTLQRFLEGRGMQVRAPKGVSRMMADGTITFWATPEDLVLIRREVSLLQTLGQGAATNTVSGNTPETQQIRQRLFQFSAARRTLAGQYAQKSGFDLPPEVDRFFQAALGGDRTQIEAAYQETTNILHGLYQRSAAFALLFPVEETRGAYQVADTWPAKTIVSYGWWIQPALKPGTVYLAHAGPYLSIPALFNGPAGTNAIIINRDELARGPYLQYLQWLYGDRLDPLDLKDSEAALQTYVDDARRRYTHDKQFPNEPAQLKSGESVKLDGDRTSVSGEQAVRAINDALVWKLRQKNPGIAFILEDLPLFPPSAFTETASKPDPAEVMARVMEMYKGVEQMRAAAGTNIFKPEIMRAYKAELGKIMAELQQGLKGTEAEVAFQTFLTLTEQEMAQSKTNGGALDPELQKKKQRAKSVLKAFFDSVERDLPNTTNSAAPSPPVPLDSFLPTPAQLGSGWVSNRLVVLSDPLVSPSVITNANEGPGWVKEAEASLRQPGAEAHAVYRYFLASSNSVLVYLNRYKTAEAVPDNWAGKMKVVDATRIAEEAAGGAGYNVTFRRGNFLVSVQGLGASTNQLVQLATAMDQNLVKRLSLGTARQEPGKADPKKERSPQELRLNLPNGGGSNGAVSKKALDFLNDSLARERLKDANTAKLDQIRLEKFGFTNALMVHVCETLRYETRRLDRSDSSLDFVLIDYEAANKREDLGDLRVTIAPPLTNVSLRAALDAVMKAASEPLEYAIEPFGVAISYQIADADRLWTRIINVDTNTFYAGLYHLVAGSKKGETAAVRNPDPAGWLTPTKEKAQELRAALEQYLTSQGVDVRPPRSVYCGGIGKIVARATMQELEKIERQIYELQKTAPTPEEQTKTNAAGK